MKKFTFLKIMLLAAFFTLFGFVANAQGAENFEGQTLPTSYGDGSFTNATSGVTWTYGHSRDQEIYPITGVGLMLRRASDSYLEATISGGVGKFSFQYRKAYTGASPRQLELLVNGTQVATTSEFGGATGADATTHDFSFDVNTGGTVVVRIKNVGTTTGNRQSVIDNISWTAYSGAATPVITANPTLETFSSEIGGSDDSKNIAVTGVNLTSDITAALSGPDASQFTFSPSSITQTDGSASGTIIVTYTPSAAAATHTATLTLSSTAATDVEITLNGETTEPIVTEGDGTEENPYTVADVKLLNNSISSTAWVRGYIVGVPSAGNGTDLTTVDLEAPFTSNTAIALADVAGETDLSKMIGVQLPAGSVRTDLNLQDNEALLGRGVNVFGTLEGYFSNTPGVRNTSAYVLDPTTGLFNNSLQAAQAWTSNGKVMLQATAGEMIEIFNIAGQKVVTRVADDGLNSVDVPVQGVVIVKAGNRVSKVIL